MMNVFVVPSWYPSSSSPIYGIFVREEIDLLAQYFPSNNYAVSIWGQGEEAALLWSREPVRSFLKILNRRPAEIQALRENFIEYRTPTFIWTRNILKGNIQGIIKSNLLNFEKAQAEFGKIDLIYVHASYPGVIIASWLSKKFGVPFVLKSRMSPFPFSEFKTISGELVSWLSEPISRASKVICTSRHAEKMLNYHGVNNTIIIPNTTEFRSFQPQKNEHNLTRLIGIGRLVPQKGFDILLEAFAKSSFNGTLRIVGEGPDRLSLEALAKKLGIADNVIFTGEKDRQGVIEEIKQADIFVLSSRHETFGNVVLEAAACGKPVIATRCGGPEDIVNDAIGILIDNENIDQLANALNSVPVILEKFDPDKIRKNVLERFGNKKILNQVNNLFKEVISTDSSQT